MPEETEKQAEAVLEKDEQEEGEENEVEEAETPETDKSAALTSQLATTPSSNNKKLIVDDPYDYDKCQISLTITWLPNDGDPNGRQVIVSARNHLDAPIIRQFRDIDINLPQPFEGMLNEIRSMLPQRLNEKYKRELEAKPKRSVSKPVAAGSQDPQVKNPEPQATLFGVQV